MAPSSAIMIYTATMPLPKFDGLLLPILSFIRDGQEHSLKETVEHVADVFKLSETERNQLLPSGYQRVIVNRTSWARTFLKKAEFLHYSRRGFMQISKRGEEYLAGNPQTLTVADLRRYPEFKENWNTATEVQQEQTPETSHDLTPEEQIENAFGEIEKDLAKNLLEQISNLSPGFFERLVVDVLIKMGYGGSLKDAGRAIGKSGDGGIDGIIKEDKLGLDTIYIQAKCWEGTVGRPEIQKFMGALAGNRAKKGVFITTSSFSSDAVTYAASIDTKIVLIDGKQLAELMIEHDVGVSLQATYTVKRLDADYFSEV